MVNKRISILSKTVFFMALLFLSDFIIGNSLRHLYFNSPFKTTYSLHKTNQEILIFGSSRASHHYDPRVFSETLNISCFNNGRDGQNIYYHSAVLAATLSRYKPEYILLDIVPWDFAQTASKRDTDPLNILLPYYKKGDEELKNIVGLRGPFEKFKHLSNCYPYNSRILNIVDCYSKQKDRNFGKQGYLPLSGTSEKVTQNRPLELDLNFDYRKIAFLEDFIIETKENNIILIMLVSPTLNSFDSEKIGSIAEKHQIEFWDYSDNEQLSKVKYFKDRSHMNSVGAEHFSKEIAGRINMIETGKGKTAD